MNQKIFEEMAEVEKSHWWFKSRTNIVNHFIKKEFYKRTTKIRILEIGCGSGGNFEMLSSFGDITAIEPNNYAYNIAKNKGIANKIYNDIFNKKYFSKESFDLILMTDVLEHIEEDSKLLSEVKPLLKKTGTLLLTVPAKKSLWSEHDTSHMHYRRYEKIELKELLSKHFNVKKLSFMNFFLYLPILIIRKVKKDDVSDSSLRVPNKIINKLLTVTFSFEKYLLSITNFPIGVSLIAICKRK